MKIPSLLLFAIATMTLSTSAAAIPLVYQCKIFDYLGTGAEVTDFQYSQVGDSFAFSSAYSTARIYLNEERTLHLSIRPKVENGASMVYAATTGYSLPHRLDVVLSHGYTSPAYAARLSCDL